MMEAAKKEAPTAAEVEAAVSAAAKATSLPTAEVIGKQPMTQFHQGFYWCNVCNAGMNCETALDMHLAGKKHRSKLARVDSAMFTPHVPLGPLPHAGSGGNAPKRKKSGSGAAAAPPGKPPALTEPTFKCEICECDFNNEIPYQAHMSGKRHLKKMNAPQISSMNSRFSCAICQFVGTSPVHLEAHLQGKAHCKKAGLPAPPPGPAVTAPSAEKKNNPKRFNPYFKPKDHNSSGSGGYYQTTRVPQVKSVNSIPNLAQIPTVDHSQSVYGSQSAHSAAYTTGIVGNYGFQLFDK